MIPDPSDQPAGRRPAPVRLRAPGLDLPLGPTALIMGILNVTPDSFSDGGRYHSPEEAVSRAEAMAGEGADLIDIGGESSRPGSEPVSAAEEIRRVLPVIERMAGRISVPISIDTTKSEVAKAALSAGARLVNDISGLRSDPAMAPLVAREGVPVVMMHMKGTPKDMQLQPEYRDVIGEIRGYFVERVKFARNQGIREDQIILDPGIGFGKTVDHNLEILARLGEFRSLGYPLLVGPSRKSFIGNILGLPVEERLEGTLGAAAAAILQGASILRVHDVRAVSRMARVIGALGRYSHV